MDSSRSRDIASTPAAQRPAPSAYIGEAVIFTGLQGAGKSTFFRERFFSTHIRINLDMLRTRHREMVLLRACIEMKQSFVVDNTNPTVEERARYIAPARAARFRIVGYYFDVPLDACLARNANRPGRERIPARGLHSTHRHLQPPTFAEDFDILYRVQLADDRSFLVDAWADQS